MNILNASNMGPCSTCSQVLKIMRTTETWLNNLRLDCLYKRVKCFRKNCQEKSEMLMWMNRFSLKCKVTGDGGDVSV